MLLTYTVYFYRKLIRRVDYWDQVSFVKEQLLMVAKMMLQQSRMMSLAILLLLLTTELPTTFSKSMESSLQSSQTTTVLTQQPLPTNQPEGSISVHSTISITNNRVIPTPSSVVTSIQLTKITPTHSKNTMSSSVPLESFSSIQEETISPSSSLKNIASMSSFKSAVLTSLNQVSIQETSTLMTSLLSSSEVVSSNTTNVETSTVYTTSFQGETSFTSSLKTTQPVTQTMSPLPSLSVSHSSRTSTTTPIAPTSATSKMLSSMPSSTLSIPTSLARPKSSTFSPSPPVITSSISKSSSTISSIPILSSSLQLSSMSSVPIPTSSAPIPSSSVPIPTSSSTIPSFVSIPTLSASIPKSSASIPTTSVPIPSSSVPIPSSSVSTPTSSASIPTISSPILTSSAPTTSPVPNPTSIPTTSVPIPTTSASNSIISSPIPSSSASIQSTALTTTASITPSPTPPAAYVIFANRNTIRRVNLDESDFKTVIENNTNVQNTIALDYDIRQNYLIWSDVRSQTILMSDLNGNNITVLVESGLTVPDGLAWDWLNQKLYWTDSEHREIEVLDPLSGDRRRLLSTGTATIPRGIVVDPNTRWLYWTDWGEVAKIERASMDGDNRTRQVLHSTNLVWPNDLTIDFNSSKLFWIDANLDKIESSNLDGTNRTLVTRTLIFHPFSITFYDRRLYWTDWAADQILHASLSNPTSVTALTERLPTDPMALKVVDITRQPIESSANPCMVANGNCSHLCLLSAFLPVGYSCSCPVGMIINEDRMTCMNMTLTPTTTDPGQGSCVAAGYSGCCTTGACLGLPPLCFCDAFCSETDSCCSDISLVCDPASGIVTMTMTQSLTMTPTPTPAVSPTPEPRPSESYLVFANRRFIHRLEIGGSVLRTLFFDSNNNSVGVDFDYRRGFLYWTDLSSRRILRSTLDGDTVSTVVNGSILIPDGIAVDWITNKVYWTDATLRTINVFDVERGHRKILFTLPNTSVPRGIALDPLRGIMFWTDWGTPAKIETASMDGTGRRTIADTDLVWPNDITIDYETDLLFWVDASLDKIERANFDGSNRQVVLSSGIFHPFSITVYNNTLYWTDWQQDSVFSKSTFSNTSTVVYSALSTDPMGIEVVSEDRQPPSTNYCGSDNGGCDQLCLLNAIRSFTCACTEDYILSDDGKNCTDLSITTMPPVTTTSTPRGSCRRAGYTTCCVGAQCEGVPGGCFCDAFCGDFDDCCDDFDEICPLTGPTVSVHVTSRPSTSSMQPSSSTAQLTSTQAPPAVSTSTGQSLVIVDSTNTVSTLPTIVSTSLSMTPLPTTKPEAKDNGRPLLTVGAAIGGAVICVLLVILILLLITFIIVKKRTIIKYETFDNPHDKELENVNAEFGISFKNPLATESDNEKDFDKKETNSI